MAFLSLLVIPKTALIRRTQLRCGGGYFLIPNSVLVRPWAEYKTVALHLGSRTLAPLLMIQSHLSHGNSEQIDFQVPETKNKKQETVFRLKGTTASRVKTPEPSG